MLDLDGLLALIAVGLLVFCLIDCIQTPADEIRGGIGKGFWIILIIIVQVIGPIAWLVAGRPSRSGNANGWRMGAGFPEDRRPSQLSRAPTGPDDDEDFLREMRAVSSEQEDTLNRWEADLRRREAEQRHREDEQRRRENGDQPPQPDPPFGTPPQA